MCGRCLTIGDCGRPCRAIAFANSSFVTLLSNHTAVGVTSHAKWRGFDVEVDNSCDDWDYVKAANYFFARLRSLRETSSRVCLISGRGNVTVGSTSGAGGRNQQFAVPRARRIEGERIRC